MEILSGIKYQFYKHKKFYDKANSNNKKVKKSKEIINFYADLIFFSINCGTSSSLSVKSSFLPLGWKIIIKCNGYWWVYSWYI